MKILYFHQYFTTPDGAGSTRSYKFAKKLVECGHEVTLVCGTPRKGTTGVSGPFVRGRRSGQVAGINIIELELSYSNYFSLPKRALVFIRFAFRSIAIALHEDYDLLFATSTPLTAGIPGIFAKIFRRKIFVFEVRDLWPELPRAMGVVTNPLILWAMSLLEWLSYHLADRCIGLSPGIVEGIQRRGIKKSNIVMIPNGCDLDIFFTNRSSFLTSESLNNDELIAIFAGSHGKANGLDAVLDAAFELKRRNCISVKLIFVGDGQLKPYLMKRAFDMKLDNCLFYDPIPKKSLAELFTRVHIGLMILDNIPEFYYGTSPNKFFDYISSGLPILNNYPGWLADLIECHECGIVVPPNDPKSFADALECLSRDKEWCIAMGRKALKLAETQFSREKLADQFVQLIESLKPLVRSRSVFIRTI